ncbi:protein spinster homolog 1-like [Paramacrobiotus metropolitanus]|uniref:protein spinster homolog 1-like n=1 Tax=Paramacrobiotus metropolitanus TaxID=2943436 RepID=UPI0024457DCB|nr:protein spinster homolog 1-like [Paramacrobiotus metropolitanus]
METPMGSDNGHGLSDGSETSRVTSSGFFGGRRRAYIGVAILFFVNLLNYIDRFTIAGVLDDIQDYYHLSKAQQGLLQTIFIVSYMLLAPLFGYLGDRYSRKFLMCIGIFFWSLTTLLGSFIPEGLYWLFFVIRGLVGIGEASYSTIAPTIISDLFTDKMRSRMLGAFYFAIPVGSGLGFMIGSSVAKAAGGWWWALRVTPGFGFLAVFLIAFLLQDPPRGSAEGGTSIEPTPWSQDLKSLVINRSFIWSTMGFTCVAFVAGALSFWAPQFMMYAVRLNSGDPTVDQTSVSFTFGIITCFAGIVGVGLGSFASQKLRSRSVRADPLICATGMLAAAPFLYFCILSSRYYPSLTWALVFFGETLLCLNWPIVADMALYVVLPPRRSTAEAFQILASHTLGDAVSPYIVGAVSDAVKALRPWEGDSNWNNWNSLQDALYVTTFVCVIGALCFVITSWYVEKDKRDVDVAISEAAFVSSAVTLSQSGNGSNYGAEVNTVRST